MVKKRKERIGEFLNPIRGELTLCILECILRIAEGTIDAFVSQKDLYRRIKFDDYKSTKFCNQLRSMKNLGYIKIDKYKGVGSVKLTNKGRIKLIENNRNRETDSKWRMLSFDIPERLSKRRNQFRRSITRIGFKQVQKSLWACPYVRAEEVELIIDELSIRQYVAYMVVEKTDISDYLRKLFSDK